MTHMTKSEIIKQHCEANGIPYSDMPMACMHKCFACGTEQETFFYQDELVSGNLCTDGKSCLTRQESNPCEDTNVSE